MRGLKESNIINGSFFKNSDAFIYSFHMPLFFLLSGFLFLDSINKNLIDLIAKRLKNLIYPFIIWSIIQTALEVLFSRHTNSKIPVDRLLMCLIIPRAQFWFLYALFFITITNVSIYKINLKFGWMISMFVWLLFFIVHPNFGPLNNAFRFLIYFNIGIAFSMFRDHFLSIIVDNRFLAINIFLFATAGYFYAINFKGIPFITGYGLISGVCGSLLVMQLSERALRKQIFPQFVVLGKDSLPIYLTHVIFASGIRIFLHNFLKIENPIIHLAFGLAGGLILPLVLYLFVMNKLYLSWIFVYPKQLNMWQN